MIQICPACESDLPEACELYNDYAASSIATFDLEARSLDSFAASYLLPPNFGLAARDESDKMLGFVSLGPFIHRAAAAQTVEIALYLRSDSRGLGLGSRLLEAAHEAAKAKGITCIIAVITSENQGSCRFFERRGYTFAGAVPKIAHKLDQDLGVSYYQRLLS
jgi:L-amino acid N-acyltransferase YncA